MKIVETELFPIAWPLSSSETVSARPLHSRTIIIRVHTDSGLYGLGEAATSLDDNSSTLSSLLYWIGRYGAAISGNDATNINALHQTLDVVSGQYPPGCQRARAAIDMAVHDIVGKARGCPVHEVIGGAYRREMQVSARISGKAATDVAASARAYVEAGFGALTIEIGSDMLPPALNMADLEEKCARLSAVLRAVGSDVCIDADANESLGNPALVSRLFEQILSERFCPNLALVQPLNKHDLLGHSDLRSKLKIPVVLTAPIVSAEAMMQVERIGAADRIGLSLERVGGLRNAMQIADICEAAAIGITPVVSSLTGIGASALLHFAAALHDPYPVDLGEYRNLSEGLVRKGPLVRNGLVSIDGSPGLGVEIDEELLRSSVIPDLSLPIS
jgi:L-alanine-DL-glutamate epimerase-like enolase superfamily enzyme